MLADVLNVRLIIIYRVSAGKENIGVPSVTRNLCSGPRSGRA